MTDSPKKTLTKWIVISPGAVVLAAVIVAAVFILGGGRVAYESPSYRVIERFDDVELREYDAYLVAETVVDGDLEKAGNRGFRVLADYIFGNNRGQAKIAMTTPVSQQSAEGTKIAMTTPVAQRQRDGQFVLSFMMPSKYSRETLPVPNDARVTIREVPPRTVAALRYSGTWSKRNYEKGLERLHEALARKGLEPVGEPIWARYNPPFTPWFLRRNEIMTEFRRMEVRP